MAAARAVNPQLMNVAATDKPGAQVHLGAGPSRD
jgi:hypothetical protein